MAITPFLWFDSNAEEAVNFYCSVFKDSKITSVSRYQEGGPGSAGQVMVMTFELMGQKFMALNGGPHFKFTEAVSFMIPCENQAEVDYYWDKLIEGGEASMCRWLKDKFGLSWQVTPTMMGEVLGGPDPQKAKAAMAAMMKMVKLDIAELRRAYDEG
jgi:predicted 3-demethylubiquinone-9 3-methyltransferase (glyoxalase superfamily)